MADNPPPRRAARFTIADVELEVGAERTVLACHYDLDGTPFTERVTIEAPPADGVDAATVAPAARLVHLLAGVSYFKAGAPPVLAVAGGLTAAERALVTATYTDGLGEFAHRNGIDLGDLVVEADDLPEPPAVAPDGAVRPSGSSQPLIPFGGGLDSIVTVEGLRGRVQDPSLFVVSRGGDRFAAIEDAAAVTGLPVVRAGRTLDGKILRSAELGYLNGHVPVTGVLSAIAVTAAAVTGHDAVVMSNEWSASSGNLVVDGRTVNHQWSKSLAFEDLFRAALLDGDAAAGVDYFSWLRPFSELWVGSRFADLGDYHQVFRSCNRSFHLDPAARLDHWCGRCDKCAFIDLVLAPFLPTATLEAIFDGTEPLARPELEPTFRTLLGLTEDAKPFECVGDVDECRVAAALAARRDDRADDRPAAARLRALAAELAERAPFDVDAAAATMAAPLGPHRIPATHAPPDLLG